MGKLPAFQFYPGDWLRDPVSSCSLGAQGLWLRLMIIMHDSEKYGYLQQNGKPMSVDEIARRVGCYNGVTELLPLWEELVSAGIPRQDKRGIFFSKRMVHDDDDRAQTRARVRKHRVSVTDSKRSGNGDETAMKQRSSSSSSSSIKNNNSYSADAPKKDPSTTEIVLADVCFPDAFSRDDVRDAFGDWLNYKRDRGESYKSQSSIAAIWECANGWAPEQFIGAVKHSMASNYGGLFPAPSDNGSRPTVGQSAPSNHPARKIFKAGDAWR